MSAPPTPKKRSMFKRLFSKKSLELDDDERAVGNTPSCVASDMCLPSTSKQGTPLIDETLASAPVGLKKKVITQAPAATPHDRSAQAPTARPQDRPRKISAVAKKRKGRKDSAAVVSVDTEKPLSFPCTPELILEYHKRKAFLSSNEEWLLVELNEYECLVENEDIIKMIAKHSKFFEVDPDELWAEFFDFVGELSCYDDVINYDVWQEFRDKKYLC